MALTQRQLFWKTVGYFLGSTGIPVNFGITIALGFIVGAAVTGQTLYLFIVESLKQFGALKSMGLRNSGILGMILLQALFIGTLGFGLGVGLTSTFFIATGNITHLAGLHMTWVALLGSGARQHRAGRYPRAASAICHRAIGAAHLRRPTTRRVYRDE